MNSFSLKIVTPDGSQYDGTAEALTVRTTSGDMGILAGHIDCIAPLGEGRVTIFAEGKRKHAACAGGMVAVRDGKVTLVTTSFSWEEDKKASPATGPMSFS